MTTDANRRIVNIINFIRGCEPRVEVDLVEPVAEQIRLVNEHGLPATFLIQYDALCQERFTRLLTEELDERCEIGAWLEVVQPLVEKAGLPWRGRFPWDWHAHVGFTLGYTPAERERLIDVLMADFAAAFGRLPRSVGSWFIDAHSLGYLADRYGIVASCNCKDQVGTDGYTVWGGYWNQAYYPSRRNAYMPAQTAAEQIPVPVFRMLGSDPIEQYDRDLGKAHQGVTTLEPVYAHGGGSPAWVRWFFDVAFREPCLAFAYAQVGQENSFGWPRMRDGLTDQIELVAEWAARGELRVETLEDSARWFRSAFPVTPATAVTALTDWRGTGRRAVWYESRFYRTSLLWENGRLRIRDIHLFHEGYASRYLTEPCTEPTFEYETLPVMDGFRWSTPAELAGIRPVAVRRDGSHERLRGGEPVVTESGDSVLLIDWPLDGGGSLRIRCEPETLTVTLPHGAPHAGLEMAWSRDATPPTIRVEPRQILFEHCGFPYVLRCRQGTFTQLCGKPAIRMLADDGTIVLDMNCTSSEGSQTP